MWCGVWFKRRNELTFRAAMSDRPNWCHRWNSLNENFMARSRHCEEKNKYTNMFKLWNFVQVECADKSGWFGVDIKLFVFLYSHKAEWPVFVVTFLSLKIDCQSALTTHSVLFQYIMMWVMCVWTSTGWRGAPLSRCCQSCRSELHQEKRSAK